MATEIDFNSYMLHADGFKVYTIPSSIRVLVRDQNNLWFMAQRKDNAQFSPIPREGRVTVFGSLSYIEDLCERFASSEAALATKPWEC